MKKNIIVLALVLFGFHDVKAQDFVIGAKAGVNFSRVTGDDVNDVSMKVGPFIGGYANLGLTEKIRFQPELLYSMQGAKTDSPETKISFDYLNIPLMFQYGITENIHLEAGPQVGILLSAEREIAGVTVDVKEITKSLDFGVNIGGVYYMENGLNFTLRYGIGLTTTSDIGDTEVVIGGVTIETEAVDIKNGVLSIGVGYNLL